MKPLPMHVPPSVSSDLLAEGDIVTFAGFYNRPITFSWPWWRCLIFGRVAGFHFVGLQQYKITGEVSSDGH